MDKYARNDVDEDSTVAGPRLVDLSVERLTPHTSISPSATDTTLPKLTIVGLGEGSLPARVSFHLSLVQPETPFKVSSLSDWGNDWNTGRPHPVFPGLSAPRGLADVSQHRLLSFELAGDRLKPDFTEYLDAAPRLLNDGEKAWAEGLLADDPSITKGYDKLRTSVQFQLRIRAAEDLVVTQRSEMEAKHWKQQQSFINSGPIIPDPRPVSEKPVSALALVASWNLSESVEAKLGDRIYKLDEPDRTLRAIDRIHSLLAMVPNELVKEFEATKSVPSGTSLALEKSPPNTSSKADLAAWLAGEPSPNAEFYAAIFLEKDGAIRKDLDSVAEHLVGKVAGRVDEIAAQSIELKKRIDGQLETIRMAQEALPKDSANAAPSSLTWLKYVAEQGGRYPTTQQPIKIEIQAPKWHPNDKITAVQSAYVRDESDRQALLTSSMQQYAKLQEQQEKLDLARDMAEYTSLRDAGNNDLASEMLLNIWSEHGIRFAYKKDGRLVLSVDEALTARKNWLLVTPMLELGTEQSMDQGITLLRALPEYKSKGLAVIEPIRNRALMSINSAPEIMAAVGTASKVQPMLSELSIIVRTGNEDGNYSEDMMKKAKTQAESLQKLLDNPGVSPLDLQRAISKMESLVDGDDRNGEIHDSAAHDAIQLKVDSLKKVLAFLSPDTAEGRQIRQILSYVRGAAFRTESVSKWLLEHGPELLAGLTAFAAVTVTLASCGAATPLAVAALGTAGSMVARESVRLGTYSLNEKFGYTGIGRRLDNPPLAEFARQFPNRSPGERLESFYTDIVMPYSQEWALNTAILYGTMNMANSLAGVEAVGQHEVSFLSAGRDLAVMGAFELGGRGTELLARDVNRFVFDGKAPQSTAMFFHITGGFAMAFGMAKACRTMAEFDQSTRTMKFTPSNAEAAAAFVQACKEQNLPIKHVGDHFELSASDLPDHLRQSMQFTDFQQLNRPMSDGFLDGGKFQTFDAEGRIVSKPQRYVMKFDATTDPILFEVTEMAKRQLADLPERERASALVIMVNELFSGGEMSTRHLLDSVMARRAALAGKEVPVGELIQAGEGVCIERAALMKYIGDRVGLRVNLVRGASGMKNATSLDHAWTEVTFSDGKTLIYDPAAEVYGAHPGDNLRYLYRRGANVVIERVMQKEAGARLAPSPEVQECAVPVQEELNPEMQKWFEHDQKMLKLEPEELAELQSAVASGQLRLRIMDRNFLRSANMMAHESGPRKSSQAGLPDDLAKYDPLKATLPILVTYDPKTYQYHVMNGNNRVMRFGSNHGNPGNHGVPVWQFNSPEAFNKLFGVPARPLRGQPFKFD